ncbi:MAG: MFS transporter [Aquificaceae bacterium]
MHSQNLRLIRLFGIVSLLADFTYEGARSILAPYLQSIGASAFLIGTVTGFGEALSYLSRYSFGVMIERGISPKRLLFAGYFLNLSVGLLGVFQNIFAVSFLFWIERLGKAMRSPARDIVIKDISKSIGYARGFGIYGFFDQIGALLGPFFVYVAFSLGFSYKEVFASLSIPAILSLFVLFFALRVYKDSFKRESSKEGLWSGVWGFGFLQAGVLSFGIVGIDLIRGGLSAGEVAIFYALGMAFAGIGSLIFGEILSRSLFYGVLGLCALIVATPFGLLGSQYIDAIGVILWGLSLGALESVSKVLIATKEGGGRHFGALEGAMGLGALFGGAIQGGLYEFSPKAVLVFCIFLSSVGGFGAIKSALTSK